MRETYVNTQRLCEYFRPNTLQKRVDDWKLDVSICTLVNLSH